MNKFVEVQSEDGSRSYKLLFSTHALAFIEQKLDIKLGELEKLLPRMGISEIRVMFWAGLEGARVRLLRTGGASAAQAMQYTEIEAGEILDEVGGLASASRAIQEGIKKAFNVPQEESAQSGGEEGEESPT